MRYQCHECDRRFEEPDIITESHGFNDGIAEEHGVCPFCKGYFEEMHKCKICGEYFTDDELTNDVCDFCFCEYDNDIEICYAISKGADESVNINSFLASVFAEDEINEILMSYARLTQKIEPISCREFIESDKEWFAEKIKENKNVDNYLR